jgi:hypothetical protein
VNLITRESVNLTTREIRTSKLFKVHGDLTKFIAGVSFGSRCGELQSAGAPFFLIKRLRWPDIYKLKAQMCVLNLMINQYFVF